MTTVEKTGTIEFMIIEMLIISLLVNGTIWFGIFVAQLWWDNAHSWIGLTIMTVCGFGAVILRLAFPKPGVVDSSRSKLKAEGDAE